MPTVCNRCHFYVHSNRSLCHICGSSDLKRPAQRESALPVLLRLRESLAPDPDWLESIAGAYTRAVNFARERGSLILNELIDVLKDTGAKCRSASIKIYALAAPERKSKAALKILGTPPVQSYIVPPAVSAQTQALEEEHETITARLACEDTLLDLPHPSLRSPLQLRSRKQQEREIAATRENLDTLYAWFQDYCREPEHTDEHSVDHAFYHVA